MKNLIINHGHILNQKIYVNLILLTFKVLMKYKNKRPKFYFELDPMIPSKYLSKLQLTYLHTKQDGLIHIKSLHDSTNSNNKFKKFIIFHIL